MSDIPTEQTTASSAPFDWKAAWLPRLAGLIELTVFALLIAALDKFVLPGSNLYALVPNPYWLPVILLSLQHGTATGLTAALLAGATYFNYGVEGPAETTLGATQALRIFLEPVLWILTVLLLGFLKSRKAEQEISIGSEIGELREKNAALAQHCLALSEHNESLQKQLNQNDRAPVEDICNAMNDIRLAPFAEIQEAAARAIRLLLGGVKFSIFLRAANGIVQDNAWGWDDEEIHHRFYLASDELHDLVIDKQRVLSIARAGDCETLRGHGVLAGPLVTANQDVLGMLKIEQVSGDEVSPETTVTFSYLCRQISQAYDRQNSIRYTAPLVQRIRGLISEQQETRLDPAMAPSGHGAANDDSWHVS